MLRWIVARDAEEEPPRDPASELIDLARLMEQRLKSIEALVADTARGIAQRLHESERLIAESTDKTGTRLEALSRLVAMANVVDVTRLLDFELAHHPRYSDPRRLLRHAAQVCSQNGEDGMITEIFRRIGTTNRTFAEIGVDDGNENNTAFLLSLGWKGFWLDGSDAFVQTLRSRPDLHDSSLTTQVAHVTRENIAGLFHSLGVPNEFDLLSIDIDQNTYYAWDGLREFRPRVVVVEYNSAIPPDVDWKVRYDPEKVWNGTNNYSASLKAYELLAADLGYSLVGCDFTGVNAFFVRNDLVGDRFVEPFTSDNHYEPPRLNFLITRSRQVRHTRQDRPDDA